MIYGLYCNETNRNFSIHTINIIKHEFVFIDLTAQMNLYFDLVLLQIFSDATDFRISKKSWYPTLMNMYFSLKLRLTFLHGCQSSSTCHLTLHILSIYLVYSIPIFQNSILFQKIWKHMSCLICYIQAL